ncbi:carbohydrate porin [Telmatospirillum siberiense]|uniref:Carbohydrate porin n=1 Tax=Telmatospirillum siberiense TaxID=382514 RepID=A0A2N3PM25_9PROT|nr:carbohydrate porin [Telmatospirillum siberiense]PKU21442.1 carbohydrate porin [Telmatospirillum siberiense]
MPMKMSATRKINRGPAGLLFAMSMVGVFAAAPAIAADGDNEAPADDLWSQDTLTGDWGGLRTRLVDSGVTIGLTEVSELLGNVSGGQRQGFDYMGRTELAVDLDLEKLLGWHGSLIHANGYQIHGRGLTGHNLGGNMLDPSNIEATRTTRLFDAYFQQALLDDTLSVRIGQIAADDEFLTSQYAANFINGTFGWAGIMAADLPSGGPAYPLATPGVRVKYAPNEQLSWQTALFNGDPAGSQAGNDNAQIRNRAGTTFSTNRDLFAITEAAYAFPADRQAGELPATVKLGGWYHSARFDDLRYDVDGDKIGATGADPRRNVNNYGLYGVIDKMLIAKPDTEDQGLSGFLRMAGAPDDRNLVSFYVDTGLNYKGLFEGRDSDIAGIAFSFAKVSDAASDRDKDYNRANPGATRPVRDYEAVIELTYQYAAAPWWIIQPDIQYIIHPAGYAASPTADTSLPASAMKDAFVLGARTTVKF